MRWPAFATLGPGSRRLLPGLLVLAAAAELFAYGGYGAAERRISAETRTLAARLQDEDAPLRSRLHALAAAPAQDETHDAGAHSSLEQVDEAATRSGVRITRLAPSPQQPTVLQVELAASFPQFLRFAADLELLHGSLHGLQIRAPDDTATTGDRRVISFVLEMPAYPVRVGRRAATTPADVTNPLLRDPFLPEAVGSAGTDLSQRYRLTGITRIGASFMATIDERDYQVGDRLGDMTVTAIDANAVQLTAGSRHYTLRFAAAP